MASGYDDFSSRPKVRGRIYVTQGTQDFENNTSVIDVRMRAYETDQQPSWHYDNLPWSINVNGVADTSGVWNFDFRPYGNQSYELAGYSKVVTHNDDGTMSVTLDGSIEGGVLGNSNPSVYLVLDRIPRGPRVKWGSTWRNSVAYVKVGSTWKIAIPYVKWGSSWKIGGG